MKPELQQAFDRLLAEADGQEMGPATPEVKSGLRNAGLSVQDLENAAWVCDELAAVLNDLLGEAD